MIAMLLLLVALAVGWLYRTEVTRYVRGIVDPMSVARRTGAPSPQALDQAVHKIEGMTTQRGDSVLLSASELASLLSRQGNLLGVAGIDSLTVELGDRRVRVRTMIDTDALPRRYVDLIPGTPERYEEVIAEGPLTPARPGVAEWQLERVIVRGLPLPSEVVARVIGRVTGQASDGRLTLRLPAGVEGFRVRPEGVAIYRSPVP
jgi:hypothetical protein